MRKAGALVAVALLTILSLAAAPNPILEKSENHSLQIQNHQGEAKSQNDPSSALIGAINKIPAAILKPQTGEERATEQKHLEYDRGVAEGTERLADATDRLANYTLLLAVFTAALISVGILQLIMFRRQWIAMRDGLGDTKKAADAALLNAEAAKTSVEALPRLERAYLFLDTNVDIAIQNFEISDIEIGEHDFRSAVGYGFKNHGRTPAIIEELHQNVDYWPKGALPSTTNTIGGNMPKGFVISGGGTAGDLGIRWPLYAEQLDLVKKNSGEILFWGRVVYLDVFGDKHETGWCRAYDPKGGYFRFFEAPKLNYYT